MTPQHDLASLYSRHRDAMYRAAASELRGAGLADLAGDAVQDAIVSIMTAPPHDVRNWEAILVNAAKWKARDRVKSAAVSHAGPELSHHHDRADGTDLAEDVVDDLEVQRLSAVARESLSVLDERHRKAVWDFAALNRPRSDIAAELGVTPGRVSQMTKKALGLLQEEINRREEAA